MAQRSDDQDEEIYRFPEFLDRLAARGALRIRDAVESETEVDGIVYHHRGVQVPADGATFLWEPDSETFRLEVEAIGPRSAWARFDANRSWDAYLARYDGGAIVAWMTDEEFAEEEADSFSGKAAAIRAGRFSFGAFFVFGPDWIERETWAIESTAPALLQFGDGSVLDADNPDEFWAASAGIPPELRREANESAPDYLGLVDAGLRTEMH